jgi:hypothetical protein
MNTLKAGSSFWFGTNTLLAIVGLLLGRWWLGQGWTLAAPAPGRRYLSGMADPHKGVQRTTYRPCGDAAQLFALLSFRSAQYYVMY